MTELNLSSCNQEQYKAWILEHFSNGTLDADFLKFLDDLKVKDLSECKTYKRLHKLLKDRSFEEIQWLWDRLKGPNKKKRKADEMANDIPLDSEQNTKRQKNLPTANKVFKCPAPAPEWPAAHHEELKVRLKRIIEINSLEWQQNVYGKALLHPLPLSPCKDEWSIFEWFCWNPLPESLEDLQKKLLAPKADNPQDSKVFLLYQVSGAGKTKLAYELSTQCCMVMIRCIDSNAFSDLLKEIFLESNFSAAWRDMTTDERHKLPYCALFVIYSWIRAHLAFLSYYQNLVNEVENEIATERDTRFRLPRSEKQMYFHLIQRNGSRASDFLKREFFLQLKHMNDSKEDSIHLFNGIMADIENLIHTTSVEVIAFDELLVMQNIGSAMFAHNELFLDQPKEFNVEYQASVFSHYGGGINTEGSPAKKFERPTSVVTGVIHFAYKLNEKVAILLTDTSKSVQSFYKRRIGSRQVVSIHEHIPKAYLTEHDLWKILNHYFGIEKKSKDDASWIALHQFVGRARFFVSKFLVDNLLEVLRKSPPQDSKEATELILPRLKDETVLMECNKEADEIVTDFFAKADSAVKLTVEIGINLAAGLMSRHDTEKISMTLSFVDQTHLTITEPFILHAMDRYRKKTILSLAQDQVLTHFAACIEKYSGIKDGKVVGKGDLLEVMVARCMQLWNGETLPEVFDLKGLGLQDSFVNELCINCCIAGTIQDFQKHDPKLEEYDLTQWEQREAFVFPSTLMKPDGITFFQNELNGTKILCLFQVKFYTQALRPSELVKAVETLNPNNFYSKKKSNADAKDWDLRDYWQAKLKTEETQKLFQQYVRVIVSANGFTQPTIALVQKYNKLPESKNQPIVLFNPTLATFGSAVMNAIAFVSGYLTPKISTQIEEQSLLQRLKVILPPCGGSALQKDEQRPKLAYNQLRISNFIKKIKEDHTK